MAFEDIGEDARWRAIQAAGQHTRLVKRLRRAIMAGCVVAALALAGLSYFNPFGGGPAFTTESASLNGTRIIMEKPRLSGYRDDGRPYDLRAATGAQDIKTPNIVELVDLDARVDTAEQSDVHLTAPTGVFDSSRDSMDLSGDIRIIGQTRFDIRLREAKMDFKAGTVVSNLPVSVSMPSGVIAGQRLLITENGKKIRFFGGVETTFTPVEPAPGPEVKP